MPKIKSYLVKVIIDGQEEELKNFGESELEVLEIVEEETGRKFEGSGSLENLRKLKKHILDYINSNDKESLH